MKIPIFTLYYYTLPNQEHMSDDSGEEFFNEDGFDGSDGFYSGDEFEFYSSEEGEEAYNEAFDRPTLERQRSFTSVKEEEILQRAQHEINDIMEVLGIPSPSIAAILLRKYLYVD